MESFIVIFIALKAEVNGKKTLITICKKNCHYNYDAMTLQLRQVDIAFGKINDNYLPPYKILKNL